MDMAVIKSELDSRETELRAFDSPCKNAGRHYVCAQAKSLKPSVKARASKLKKIISNREKQMRRRLRRRQKYDVEYEKKKTMLPF